jgi:hypothetical protein
MSFIDRFFKLCYILVVFVKVKEVKRTLRWEDERGINSFFGFSFSHARLIGKFNIHISTRTLIGRRHYEK